MLFDHLTSVETSAVMRVSKINLRIRILNLFISTCMQSFRWLALMSEAIKLSNLYPGSILILRTTSTAQSVVSGPLLFLLLGLFIWKREFNWRSSMVITIELWRLDILKKSWIFTGNDYQWLEFDLRLLSMLVYIF